MSVGQHVTLVTADGKTFNGVLNTIDDKAGKLVLKNVIADGCKLSDLQTFFASDIKDLAFLEGFGPRESHSESLLDHVKRSRGKLVSKKDVPAHLLRNPVFNGDKMLLSHIAGDDDGIDQGIGSGEDGDNVEDFYETEEYMLLCRPCEKFREVICYLMEQELVATMFYGVEIGRKGTLSILQIATKEYIFLFDMLRLGDEGFIDGLQEFLESRAVVKIIHDARMVSDMLYHQYNIVLSNVFDTQVAGAFVFRNLHGGDWPRSVESLPSALLLHLNLSEDEIHIAYVRERSRKMDEQVWLQRPLSKQLLTSTLKNLKHLFPLYYYMCQKLMLPFKVGVDIYLDHARSAPDGIAAKQRVNSHLLPFAFQDLEKMTASSCKESAHHRQRDPTYDHKGFFENTIRHGLHHNKVIKSRDSIWHSFRKGFPSSNPKQSQASKGLPPEEWHALKRKSFQSEPFGLKENLPLNETSVDSISNVSKDKNKKEPLDAPLSNLSSNDFQDSTGSEKNLKNNTSPCFDESHSPVMVTKSSTPSNSRQAISPSTSTNVSRSALFELEESPLQALDSFESELNSNLKYSDPVAKSPQTAIPSCQDNDSGCADNSRNISQHEKLVHSPSPCKGTYKSWSDTERNSSSASWHKRLTEVSHLHSKYESNLNTPDHAKMKNSHDRSYDEMNMIPAGVNIRQISKKRAKRIQEQMQLDSQRDKPVSHVTLDNKLATNDPQEELTSIPMHSTLHKMKSQMKTSSNSCGIFGEPCLLETASNSLPSSKSFLSSLNLPQCQSVTVPLSSSEGEGAEEDVEDSYIDEILKLEEVQKILRQTNLEKTSTDIRRKFLSSKIRL